jgi:pyrroloquinoline quinone biosynthesis protein B
MRIIVLGSAAGGGFPQWNCNCRNCERVRAGDLAAEPRTQASLAVSVDGQRWYLLNASPDLREQLARTPALQPGVGIRRGSPLAGVILTNADVDHVAGLLSLRERQPLRLYATQRVLDVLDANPIFGVLDRGVVERRALALDVETVLQSDASGPQLTLTAFAVPGKVALWLENGDASNLAGGAEDTIGVRLDEPGTGARFFYVPSCAAVTRALAARLQDASLLFFDGTCWSDDEMQRAGVGEKTAARMGHLSMSGSRGTIAAFATFAIGRKVFTHINNTNPVLIAGSPERAEAEAHGWEIARDGQEFTL